jgi:mRNA interferase YafQ
MQQKSNIYGIVLSNSFKSDYKRIKKRKLNLKLLEKVMDNLANGIPLEPKHRDHPLVGNYIGYRECHIKPDWLLIYYYVEQVIVFERTGSHSDLFD